MLRIVRVSREHFGKKVASLEVELTVGHGETDARICRSDDLGGVEAVAAASGLLGDGLEMAADRALRVCGRPEPGELRVVRLPLRVAEKDGLREQALPPPGQQALPVEVAGVKRPDSHEKCPVRWFVIAAGSGAAGGG